MISKSTEEANLILSNLESQINELNSNQIPSIQFETKILQSLQIANNIVLKINLDRNGSFRFRKRNSKKKIHYFRKEI